MSNQFDRFPPEKEEDSKNRWKIEVALFTSVGVLLGLLLSLSYRDAKCSSGLCEFISQSPLLIGIIGGIIGFIFSIFLIAIISGLEEALKDFGPGSTDSTI